MVPASQSQDTNIMMADLEGRQPEPPVEPPKPPPIQAAPVQPPIQAPVQTTVEAAPKTAPEIADIISIIFSPLFCITQKYNVRLCWTVSSTASKTLYFAKSL